MKLTNLIPRNLIPRLRTFETVYRIVGYGVALHKHCSCKLRWPLQRVKLNQNAKSMILIAHDTYTDQYYFISPGSEIILHSGWLRRHTYDFYLCEYESLITHVWRVDPSIAIEDSSFSDTFNPAKMLNVKLHEIRNEKFYRRLSLLIEYRLKIVDYIKFCCKFRGDNNGIRNKVEKEITRCVKAWAEEDINKFQNFKITDGQISEIIHRINYVLGKEYGMVVNWFLISPRPAGLRENLGELRNKEFESISTAICQSIEAAAQQRFEQERQDDIDWQRRILSQIIENGYIDQFVNNPILINELLNSL